MFLGFRLAISEKPYLSQLSKIWRVCDRAVLPQRNLQAYPHGTAMPLFCRHLSLLAVGERAAQPRRSLLIGSSFALFISLPCAFVQSSGCALHSTSTTSSPAEQRRLSFRRYISFMCISCRMQYSLPMFDSSPDTSWPRFLHGMPLGCIKHSLFNRMA